MLYNRVSVAGVTHVDAPIRSSSAEISHRLRPMLARFNLRETLLEEITGIRSRGIWDGPVSPSAAAAMAGRKVLEATGIDRRRIGVLINTSVSREYLEPSTACMVHGELGLSDACESFDVGNACLGFLNGMDIAARMIELGAVDYGLIVDGETSNVAIDRTVERLLGEDVTVDQFRSELASLTLGSGAAAMVLGQSQLLPEGHRYRGSVARAATEFSHLCRGNLDRMVTDTRGMLVAGLKLAKETFEVAREELGWEVEALDEVVIHQISRVHTDSFIERLGIDPAKVFRIYPEDGNTGPASIPMALSKLREAGRLQKGKRVGLVGLGSGLNCLMSEVVW